MSSPEIDVIIEIPNGSNLKYEIDNDGTIRLDRVLSCAMNYPGNYGFIPNTLAEDGDPLDALVITSYALHPGSVVRCRVLGALVMSDEKGLDEKILAVPVDAVDSSFSDLTDLEDIPKTQLDKIKHFFEHYKKTEPNKWSEVKDFLNRQAADQLVTRYTN